MAVSPRRILITLAVIFGTAAVIWFATRPEMKPEEPIRREDVTEAVEKGLVILRGSVKSRRITNPGTQSETAVYAVMVRRTLLGPPMTGFVDPGRYTHGGAHYLVPGRHYLLVISPKGPPGSSYRLLRFETATDGREKEVRGWVEEVRQRAAGP